MTILFPRPTLWCRFVLWCHSVQNVSRRIGPLIRFTELLQRRGSPRLPVQLFPQHLPVCRDRDCQRLDRT